VNSFVLQAVDQTLGRLDQRDAVPASSDARLGRRSPGRSLRTSRVRRRARPTGRCRWASWKTWMWRGCSEARSTLATEPATRRWSKKGGTAGSI